MASKRVSASKGKKSKKEKSWKEVVEHYAMKPGLGAKGPVLVLVRSRDGKSLAKAMGAVPSWLDLFENRMSFSVTPVVRGKAMLQACPVVESEAEATRLVERLVKKRLLPALRRLGAVEPRAEVKGVPSADLPWRVRGGTSEDQTPVLLNRQGQVVAEVWWHPDWTKVACADLDEALAMARRIARAVNRAV